MKNLSTISKFGVFIILAGLTFASCNTTSTNGSKAPVALRFQTAAAAPTNAGFSTLAAKQGDTLTVKGSNGTLKITDVHFIVDDFELEKAEGECEGLKGKKEDDCEEFEANLFFVDLPLNNEPLELAVSSIKNGVYSELEFEIDDLDLDENEDQAEEQQKQEFFQNKVRPEFSNWPKAASIVISGSFEANNGDVTEFTTFAAAEIEVEMALNPPLEINNGTAKRITVNINPEKWFVNQNGTVKNLADYDYSTTQKILEFEVEMEDGFESADVD